MRRVSKEKPELDTYQQRDRFNKKHSIYTWLYGGFVGTSIINSFVLIVKVTPEVINKAFESGSHSVLTLGNNALALCLAVEGVTAAVSGKKSSTYGKRTAELDGAIASHELETTALPEQPTSDGI